MRKLAVFLTCALLFVAQAYAQTARTVTGKVTDEKGLPLSGVTVSAIGADTKTVTDASGAFSIQLPSKSKSLRFSYVGFDNQDVTATGTNLMVKMKSEDKSLDEVVVVGYGTVKKRDLTGSVSTINGDKVRDQPVQSFDQALSGRAAGVNITIPNGVVNNPPVIRIRGVNSISLSSFPLVVVDGIPTFTGDVGNGPSNNPLGDINPADIESVEILKDAAASAIYGSRASAGVLLITTKKGKQGRAKVSYDAWLGTTKPFNLIPVLNGRQYEEIKNEGLTNAGTAPNGTTRGFYPYLDNNALLSDKKRSQINGFLKIP
jgi:TonB-dependent SusC/RagA subfamily outer membrane receptor